MVGAQDVPVEAIPVVEEAPVVVEATPVVETPAVEVKTEEKSS